MTSLVSTVSPIFGLILLGFFAVKLRGIEEAGVRGLVVFVFNFAIPALLLRSLADLDFPPDLEWAFLIAYYAGAFATYGLGLTVARLGFRRPLADQAIFAMSASYSNLVLMGIPVVLVGLGPDASLPMLLVIAFHSAIFLPITVALIERGRRGPASPGPGLASVFAEMARNPIIIGIVIGFALNGSGIRLWIGLESLLDILATAAVPCALFAMGASLAGYSLHGELRPAAALTALKLVVQPLLVWVVAVPILGLEGLWASVPVVLAGMPTGVNAYLFGARYYVSAEVAARTVLLTTICSVATITVLLVLLGG